MDTIEVEKFKWDKIPIRKVPETLSIEMLVLSKLVHFLALLFLCGLMLNNSYSATVAILSETYPSSLACFVTDM